MTSRLFTEAFIIFRLDEDAEPVEIIPYFTNAATYVAASISICRGMLRNPTVKAAFASFAKDFDSTPSGAWYQESPMIDVAEKFINKVLERFPIVFVDDSMKNPDQQGCHHRRTWGGDGEPFETRKQGIVINGPVSRTRAPKIE